MIVLSIVIVLAIGGLLRNKKSSREANMVRIQTYKMK